MSFFSCTPARFVKPLEQGHKAIGFNFGGGLINFSDLIIPIPYTSLYAGYGWKENTTIYSGLHLTALAFQNIQLDVGISHLLYQQDGLLPGLSGGSTINIIANKEDFRLYPTLESNIFWEYIDGKYMTYIGSSIWLDFFQNEAVNSANSNLLHPEFHIGQTMRMGKIDLTLEYKLLNPFVAGNKTVAEYAHFSEKGASGIFFSIQKRF